MSYRNTRKAFALRRAVAGLLLAACALLPVPAGPASAATCSAEENVVCTDVGAVRGVREGQTVGFKGIPYAKPLGGGLALAPARAAGGLGRRAGRVANRADVPADRRREGRRGGGLPHPQHLGARETQQSARAP